MRDASRPKCRSTAAPTSTSPDARRAAEEGVIEALARLLLAPRRERESGPQLIGPAVDQVLERAVKKATGSPRREGK